MFRILQVKKIPFNTYDLASDEEAKKLWRRKAPQGEHVTPYAPTRSLNLASLGKQQLPGILVGGKYPGVCFKFMVNRLKQSHFVLLIDI